MPVDPSIRAAFRRPFAEQIAFFRGKLGDLVPTATWRDVMRSAHDRAFMVAGAARADLLADLAAAVDAAIAQGESIGQFRARFAEIVQRRGWQGWTGSATAAGRAWRTRIIYATNARTSYAAGREAQLLQFPYLVYRHGGSADPRPQHLAWDGLVLPRDHPFWRTHSPPNGWGCSCFKVGVRSPQRAARLGGDPDKQLPQGWDVRRPDGELPGIDEGWDYAPGATTAQQIRDQVLRKDSPRPPPLQVDLESMVERVMDRVTSADAAIALGQRIAAELPDAAQLPEEFRAALLERLRREVGIDTAAAVATGGRGAKLIQRASQRLPDTWTRVADELGPLNVRTAQQRAYQYTERGPGGSAQLPGFGSVTVSTGEGFIVVNDELSTAVHEFAHRIQAALPELDAVFQAIHKRRTEGAELKLLKDITGQRAYGRERTREDSYIHPYQGKEYTRGGALEVMSMALEWVLGEGRATDRDLREFAAKDPELFRLTIGLLFGWRP